MLPGMSEIAGYFPALAFRFKRNICFFPAHRQRFNIVESLRDREVGCSTSEHKGANFESCEGNVISFISSQRYEFRLVQFSIYVQKWSLKPHSFVRLFVHSFARSFVRSFVHLFICSFFHSFIHSFIHSLIHSYIQYTYLVHTSIIWFNHRVGCTYWLFLYTIHHVSRRMRIKQIRSLLFK